MANSLAPVTTDVQYFGRTLLDFLKNQLVLVNRCVTSYEGAATAPGRTINVPFVSIPAAAATRDIGGAASATAVNAFNAQVTMKQIYQAVTLDNLQNLFSNVNLMEETARQMAYNIAAKADGMVADLHKRIGNVTGETDGTAAFDDTNKLVHLNTARKILLNSKSPLNDLTLVLCPSEGAGYRSISILQQVNTAGSAELLRNGAMGQVMGFNVFESQNIVSGYTMNAAGVTASPAAVSDATVAIGATSMGINSVGAGDIPAGSSFYVKTSTTQKYAVTTQVTIAGNAATISFHPPLKEALVQNDAVVFTEYTNTTSVNLAFNRNAILCVARPTKPFTVGSGVASTTVTDEQTGLSVRIATESHLLSDTAGYTESIAADLVFGCEVVQPESACKILGLN